ncbi:polysaccharide biosynthesis tyrosine autokinase [bacterium]|nr:polysaccharide biosynthesis tyrosine autokinase [bacterium]
MAQYDLNLRDVQRILRRRWKVVLFATLLVLGFSYFFGRSRQPLYSSYSSVKVEETNTVAGLLLQRLTYTRWDNIATAQELIRSFPVMEKVAKRLGKIDRDLTSEDVRSNSELASMVNRMIGLVTTERSGRTNIIDINVTSDDPYEARDVAQTLAQVFTETHLEEKSRQDRETREFIESQLLLAQSNLNAAENRLQDFRQQSKLPVLNDQLRLRLEEQMSLREKKRSLETVVDQLTTQLGQLRQRQNLRKTGEGELKNTAMDSSAMRLIDWFSSGEADGGSIALLNQRLIELEVRKRDLLTQYKPDYPRITQLEGDIQALLSQIAEEAIDMLDAKKRELKNLDRLIAEGDAEFAKVPEAQRRYAQLEREVALREAQYTDLTVKYQEALIREADQADEVTVVRPAMLNQAPININMSRMISVGFVIGLTLGLVLAFLFETFDTSIGTIEDVEEFLQVPVLGVIPSIDIESVTEHLLRRNPGLENNPNLEASARLVTHFAPKDPVAEGYRALRTALQFRAIDSPVKTITTTSASLQEGKSTTLVNLAITMAQGGVKILLVGCNLRRPSIYKVFGIDQAPGVVDIVLGRVEWRDCIRTVTDIIMGDMGMSSTLMTPGMENLHIITSGGVPPNPAEMLVSERMKQFIDEAREEFDIILFDAPPVLPVTDAAILAKRTDATLLVYRTGKVPRAALRRAKVQIESVGATVMGVVLNDLRSELIGFSSSHYYYGKYYGASGDTEVVEQQPKRKSGWERLMGKLKVDTLLGPKEKEKA